MGLFVGSTPVKQVYVGSTPVTAVYVGSQKVWPTIDVVQITLGAGTQARDQFRAALTARGLDYATVTEIPFDIELVGTGAALQLFRGCHALTSVPALDTSQVTNMNGMFQECGSLVTVPPLDTSNVVRAPSMFAYCRSLTSVPDMDAANMVDVTDMFTGCVALTDGNVRLIGRHPDVNTARMINNSGLTREPWYKADGTPDDPTEVVQITGTSGMTSRDQLRDAVAARGLNYRTVTHLPFEIDTSQATSLLDLFNGWTALVVAPDMTTPQVTDMGGLFRGCTALEYVGDLQTSNVTNAAYMFNDCPALTDGNVRLLGKHPDVSTTAMITNSGLTREPWYTADGQPWPTAEVHEVTITNATGTGTAHPLLTVTVPAGETWDVRIQGTITKAAGGNAYWPFFRIGTADSGTYGQGAAVDFSGTVTPANSAIALVSNDFTGASFTGTVTIEK